MDFRKSTGLGYRYTFSTLVSGRVMASGFLKEMDVLPALGLCSIGEVLRQDLLQVLARIERRGSFATAEKRWPGSISCSVSRW